MQTVEQKVVLNQRPVKPRPYWYATIPGEVLMLCQDCGAGWDLRAGACDCGSRACLPVHKTLDRRGIEVGR